MAIVPIFIRVHEDTANEVRRDMEIRELMRLDDEMREARKRARIEKEEADKRRKKEEAERKINSEYEAAKRRNPYDYKIMPEGWSIFGQQDFSIITEYYDE